MVNASITDEFDPERPRSKIVSYLAQNGEASPYQITKQLYRRITAGYSTVLQNLDQLVEEGFVEFVRSVPSAKGGEQKLFGLTPFLGLTLALACAEDVKGAFQRKPSGAGYAQIFEGFEASLDILGKSRFKKLVQESLASFLDEISRGKIRSEKAREEKLLSLFVWPLLSSEANPKEIVELCRRSELIYGYLNQSYRLTQRILKKSGRF